MARCYLQAAANAAHTRPMRLHSQINVPVVFKPGRRRRPGRTQPGSCRPTDGDFCHPFYGPFHFHSPLTDFNEHHRHLGAAAGRNTGLNKAPGMQINWSRSRLKAKYFSKRQQNKGINHR